MFVLALETSCDETAAAVIGPDLRIVSNIISSQIATHRPFGGVVPEVASREHLAQIVSVTQQALAPLPEGARSLAAVASTRGPGLVGPLLVGMQFGKGLALSCGIPWLGINHLEGHLAAACLLPEPPPYPHVALLVSGGHTQLYLVRAFGDYQLLGATLDDAAGEAFDKIGKILQLPYPAGPAVDALAQQGDGSAIPLPLPLLQRGNLDFSFSDLKTAALQILAAKPPRTPADQANFCAALQSTIVKILITKAHWALQKTGAPALVLAGGVAANSGLRSAAAALAQAHGFACYLPPRALCTDNAAMIGAAAYLRYKRGEQTPLTASAKSRWPLGQGAAQLAAAAPESR